jgi:hypothetical protein
MTPSIDDLIWKHKYATIEELVREAKEYEISLVAASQHSIEERYTDLCDEIREVAKLMDTTPNCIIEVCKSIGSVHDLSLPTTVNIVHFFIAELQEAHKGHIPPVSKE